MSPDLGQYLWRHVPGARARTVAVVPVYVRSVAEAPGGTVDVSFAYYPDDDEGLPIGFMGTLNTRQSVDELLEMIRPDRPMAIVGMLARGTVTGSGCATGTRECYRLILGRLESPPADPVKHAA
jgi:hypothetical protein